MAYAQLQINLDKVRQLRLRPGAVHVQQAMVVPALYILVMFALFVQRHDLDQ